jgi:hypothetical protein
VNLLVSDVAHRRRKKGDRAMMRSSRPTSLIAVFMLGSSYGIALAGDLNPPPGPIQSTMKTLNQVEPRIDVNALPGDGTALHVISAPGSYMLTADLIGSSGLDGIKVTADGPVYVDLNGFTMRGVPGSGHGLIVGLDVTDWPVIINGIFTDWGLDGIRGIGEGSIHAEKLIIRNCGGNGLYAALGYVWIRNSAIEFNAGNAIEAGGYANIETTALVGNGGVGVMIGYGGTLAQLIINKGIIIGPSGDWGPLVIGLVDRGTFDDSILIGGDVMLGDDLVVMRNTDVLGRLEVGPGSSIINSTVTGVDLAAPSVVTLGPSTHVSNLTVRAANCVLANAIVDVMGDGVTVGGVVDAQAGTVAPCAVRLLGLIPRPHLAVNLTLGVPIGIDVIGAKGRVLGAVIQEVPSGGTGIRVNAGANGTEIEECRIAGSGAGAYTAIALGSNNNLVINNRFTALMGGTAVNNQGVGNGVGPIVTVANLGANTNPAANYVH